MKGVLDQDSQSHISGRILSLVYGPTTYRGMLIWTWSHQLSWVKGSLPNKTSSRLHTVICSLSENFNYSVSFLSSLSWKHIKDSTSDLVVTANSSLCLSGCNYWSSPMDPCSWFCKHWIDLTLYIIYICFMTVQNQKLAVKCSMFCWDRDIDSSPKSIRGLVLIAIRHPFHAKVILSSFLWFRSLTLFRVNVFTQLASLIHTNIQLKHALRKNGGLSSMKSMVKKRITDTR